MSRPKRSALNAAGDFYVKDACCMACGVPGVIAPGLFGGFDGTGREFLEGVSQCWVKKQPQSNEELDAMIETIRSQELTCIRYGGADPVILARLRNAGEDQSIDEDGP
jgi:hypothetical protein